MIEINQVYKVYYQKPAQYKMSVGPWSLAWVALSLPHKG